MDVIGFYRPYEIEVIEEEEVKYYRVTQDNFMWLKGAILKLDSDMGTDGGYQTISDVWDACDLNGEYISKRIIEAPENTKFFERVYKVDENGSKVYVTKDVALKLFSEKLIEEVE